MSNANSNHTRQARAILNELIREKAITPAGVNWLTIATDPFHDSEISVDGYPGISTSRSITQCVNLTTSISTPLDDDGLWDCHIFLNPCSYSWAQNSTPVSDPRYYRTLLSEDGHTAQDQTGAYLVGGFNAISVPNGDAWTAATTFTSEEKLGFPPAYQTGFYRLIAGGVEVTNTTSDLNKQGTVTNYRSPCNKQNGMCLDVEAEYTQVCAYGALPPDTMANAALFPNSKTWAAAAGTYSVSTLNEMENAYSSPVTGLCGLITTPNQTQLEEQATRLAYLPFECNGQANSTLLPFDINGCVFSGLSPQTTLQVTARYYFERVPSIADPNLLVLARPPPCFDPLAIEIYSKVLDTLPIAVPVGMNPLGEWFKDVLEAIAEYAPIIGGALGNVVPGAGAIGNIIGAGARGASRLMPARKTVTTTTTNPKPQGRRKQPPAKKKTTTTTVVPINSSVRSLRVAPRKRRARGRVYAT